MKIASISVMTVGRHAETKVVLRASILDGNVKTKEFMEKKKRREHFASLRNEVGLSQGEVAGLMGMKGRQRISQIETGGGQDRSPRMQHICHLVAINIMSKSGLLEKYRSEIDKLEDANIE